MSKEFYPQRPEATHVLSDVKTTHRAKQATSSRYGKRHHDYAVLEYWQTH